MHCCAHAAHQEAGSAPVDGRAGVMSTRPAPQDGRPLQIDPCHGHTRRADSRAARTASRAPLAPGAAPDATGGASCALRARPHCWVPFLHRLSHSRHDVQAHSTRCAGGCDAGGSGPRTGNQPAEWITPRSLDACHCFSSARSCTASCAREHARRGMLGKGLMHARAWTGRPALNQAALRTARVEAWMDTLRARGWPPAGRRAWQAGG